MFGIYLQYIRCGVCVVINLTAVPALDIMLSFKYFFQKYISEFICSKQNIFGGGAADPVWCVAINLAPLPALDILLPPLPPPPSPQYSGVYLQYIWYILLPPLPPPPTPHSHNNPENGLLMNTPQIVLFGNCVSPNCIRSPIFDD